MQPQIVDLSHHNIVSPSLLPAKAAGVVGVIHKATEGTTFQDSKLAARFTLATDAGLLWGVYHWLKPGNLTEQLNNFHTAVRSVLTEKTLIAVDHEDKASLTDLKLFLSMVEQRFERSVVLYSGNTLKEQLKANQGADFSMYRLWLADYTPPDDLPRGFMDYWLWQFSETGQIPGIVGNCDVSQFSGGKVPQPIEWSGLLTGPIDPDISVVTIEVPKGVKVIIKDV